MMWGGVLDFILKLAFPKAPAWIGDLLGTAVPAIIELVEAIDDATDKSGPEKFEFVISEVRELLDEGLDSIPEWSDYGEDGRDRIIGGLTELAVFVHKIADAEGSKSARRKVRRALRKLR
jgi:hypothetical protein